MISFNLICENDHGFEGWFANSAGFERQKKAGQLTCPYCGSHKLEKALMAPRVSTGKQQERIKKTRDLALLDASQKEMRETIRKLRRHVEETADNVGDKFADEARKIHYQETEARGIYGKATPAEAKDLATEGIDFSALPDLPEDSN